MAGFIRKLKRRILGSSACAVIVAAGSSTRMEGEDKIFAELRDIPVLARTMLVYERCASIDSIVVVTREDSLEKAAELAKQYQITKLLAVVKGGDTRLESVQCGVTAAPKDVAVIAIHDGARPLVTEDIIARTVRLAEEHNAAAAAVKVTSTIKTTELGVVTDTPDREKLREIQTPQAFEADLIKAALQNALDKKLAVTDDCMAVEALGATVWLSEGSYENIKITTRTDLLVADAILRTRRTAK